MDVVITLADGHYHRGLIALVNSLVRAGFEGPVICFGRESDPHWLPPICDRLKATAPQVMLHYRITTDSWHPSHQKPRAMEEAADAHLKARRLFFFDSDIVVHAPWSFYQDWADYGIALVEDPVFGNFPPHHPIRAAWERWLSKCGVEVIRQPDRYYNGGFVGVIRERLTFVKRWGEMMDRMSETVDLVNLKPGTRFDAFFNTDQDALNMTVMTGHEPISAIGPEGMGGRSASPMSHALHPEKPWNRRWLRALAKGDAPSWVEKKWFEFAMDPIPAFSPSEFRRHMNGMKLATALGRIYGRR